MAPRWSRCPSPYPTLQTVRLIPSHSLDLATFSGWLTPGTLMNGALGTTGNAPCLGMLRCASSSHSAATVPNGKTLYAGCPVSSCPGCTRVEQSSLAQLSSSDFSPYG